MAQDAFPQLLLLVRLLSEETETASRAEAAAKAAAARARAIAEEDIPELMREMELSAMKLDDGSEITIKSEVYAAIPAAQAEAAFAWLEARGFGELIKTSITLNFGRKDGALCRKMLGALMKNKGLAKAGIEPEIARGVHVATLRAFLRERLEAADPPDLPLELFGARPVQVAKIKQPRSTTRKEGLPASKRKSNDDGGGEESVAMSR